MFWNRTPQLEPRQVAQRLVAVFTNAAQAVAKFQELVTPSMDERVRLYFSVVLYPAVAVSAEAEMGQKPNRQVVEAASDIYLNSQPDKERHVSLSEYFIWENERNVVMQSFKQVPALAADYSSASDSMPYGSLLKVAHYVRKRMYQTDFQYGYSQAPNKSDQRQVFQMVLMSRSMTLVRQVLAITSHETITNPQKAERFQTAVACGGAMLGAMYFEVVDILAGK